MHIQKERQLLLVLSAFIMVFILASALCSLTADAAEDISVDVSQYPYSLKYEVVSSNDGVERKTYSADMISKIPLYGIYDCDVNGYWHLEICALDEDDTLKRIHVKPGLSNVYCNSLSYIYQDGDKPSETKHSAYNVPFSSAGYQSYYSGITLYTQGAILSCSIPLFDSRESIMKYIETGDTSGIVRSGDFEEERDFSTEYDPDVPVPQLTNLSHNGFTVANADDNHELDLVVKSTFYGWKHVDPQVTSHALFKLDSNWVVNEHYYEPTVNNEIGFTGSNVVLSKSPFNCTNQRDLYMDGHKFFDDYPKHTKLPDYSFLKHSSLDYSMFYEDVQNHFSVGDIGGDDTDNTDNTDKSHLAKTTQAVTKYYVRFYEYRFNSVGELTMISGQWYCYTYNVDGNISVSPIKPDGDGNPIETNPIRGEQDDDGNPDYGDGDGGFNLPNIDYSNPISMLGDFIDMIIKLPALIGSLGSFLTQSFGFIPMDFWQIMMTGVGFSVVFLIFRAIK